MNTNHVIIMIIVIIICFGIGILIGKVSKECPTDDPCPTCQTCPTCNDSEETCEVCDDLDVSEKMIAKIYAHLFINKLKSMDIVKHTQILNGINVDKIFGEMSYLIIQGLKKYADCKLNAIDEYYKEIYKNYKDNTKKQSFWDHYHLDKATSIHKDCFSQSVDEAYWIRLGELFYDSFIIKIVSNLKKLLENDPDLIRLLTSPEEYDSNPQKLIQDFKDLADDIISDVNKTSKNHKAKYAAFVARHLLNPKPI
jgi:hypothetical protein